MQITNNGLVEHVISHRRISLAFRTCSWISAQNIKCNSEYSRTSLMGAFTDDENYYCVRACEPTKMYNL